MRFRRATLAVLVSVAILSSGWLWLEAARDRLGSGGPSVVITQAAAPGGPFSLIDHFGQPVTDQSFRGKYLVMVFGYTFCPDVCPTTLNTVAAAVALLGSKAQAVQPLFVTIDPERDTAAVLAEYVAAFDPRLVGLTGSPAQIRQVTRDYRVYVSKVETGDDAYPIDHSAYVYVVGPSGRMLTYLKYDETPQAMATAIERSMMQQTSADGP